MQEAMAMGLLVIGTTTGGTGELLVHERTGLESRRRDEVRRGRVAVFEPI